MIIVGSLDITGNVYGRLTALRKTDKRSPSRSIVWECKCTCGNIVEVPASSLRSGHTKSCGCYHADVSSKNNFRDLVDMKFGELLVTSFAYTKSGRGSYWNCRCSCGNDIVVRGCSLTTGHTKSCGCINKYPDISGKRFGYLDVIEFSHKDVTGHYYFKCRCMLCGNITIKAGNSIRRGLTRSCGCLSKFSGGSTQENDIVSFIEQLNADLTVIAHDKNILDGKEIDIYLPELKLGIEYNGSAYHATENGIYEDKDKYYHRDKFLLAKSKGIRLISIFDVDYERYKDEILNFIKDIITNNEKHYIPTKEFEYTNNDFDDGEWLREFGYEPIEQLEPISYTHSRGYVVYRSGTTIWRK